MTRPLESNAKLGYAVLVVILTTALAYSIHRLSAIADDQVARLRSEEEKVTLAERLRWTSEHVVSSGRAYLISGDPTLFTEVENATTRFDEDVRSLGSLSLTPVAQQLVNEVQRAAGDFMQLQQEIMTSRRQGREVKALALRFDTDLLPRSLNLKKALARLVDFKLDALARSYAQARADRTRITGWLYALLGLVVLASLGIAWGFSRLLGRSYRQIENALRATRDAVAARDEMMGIVAHDLRNPLGSITMRATLLRATSDSAHTQQQAASIENVAMRMEYLIKTMLDVTTMEAGRFSLIRAACDVGAVLHESIDLFLPLASAKQVQLDVELKETGLVIHADRERVLQVLANLIGNALKFTPRNGRVTIAVEKCDDVVQFSVLDTGPGIAPQHLPHVFERFWKHDTPGIKSTGLGLFIAKSIVDAHGGRIWAESDRGRGSRFYFTIPLELSTSIPSAKTILRSTAG